MQIPVVVEKSDGFAVEDMSSACLIDNKRNVMLAVVQDKETDFFLRKFGPKRLKRLATIDNNIRLYHNGLHTYNPPRGGSSPESFARYPVWDEDTGILFQILKAGRSTSCNFHTKGPELYYPVSGYFDICECNYLSKMDKGHRYLERGKLSSVEPFYCHRGCALSGDTYTIILMPPGVGTSDHHHPEICVKNLYLIPERSMEKL